MLSTGWERLVALDDCRVLGITRIGAAAIGTMEVARTSHDVGDRAWTTFKHLLSETGLDAPLGTNAKDMAEICRENKRQ
jgi:hypothetical protein